MTNGKRNERVGAIYEKELIDEINSHRLFPILGQSSLLDVDQDRKMNDIIPVQSEKVFDYVLQAKVSTGKVFYPKLMDAMTKNFPEKTKVIFHKHTKNVNGRFLPRGKYAILLQDEFLDIMKELQAYKQGYKELLTYWDSIPDDQKHTVHDRITDLGL